MGVVQIEQSSLVSRADLRRNHANFDTVPNLSGTKPNSDPLGEGLLHDLVTFGINNILKCLLDH